MTYENDAVAIAKIGEAIQSDDFDEVMSEKWFPHIESLTIELIEDRFESNTVSAEVMTSTLSTLESLLRLMQAIALPENPVDSFVMEAVKTYVIDTTPLFHAYLIEALAIATKEKS